MPQVEGRGIRQPVVGEIYCGPNLVIRIDDKANPITWMTVTITPAEFNDMFHRWMKWLVQSEQREAWEALLAEKV